MNGLQTKFVLSAAGVGVLTLPMAVSQPDQYFSDKTNWQENINIMGTLKEDIKSQSEWIVKAFGADNFKLDYTIDSFIEIDRFFNANMQNGQPKTGGRLAKKGFGPILFSIGSYIGETIIKNVKDAEWITDDNDPEGELNVSMKLPNGMIIWPIQRVMKRFQNGNEDSIYPYGHLMTSEFTNQPFNDTFWDLKQETEEASSSKPWWKFW